MEGITKTFTLTGTKGASVRVTVSEDYNPTGNTSTLTVAAELALSSYFGHTYYLTGSVSAAGQSLQKMDSSDGTHYVTVSRLDTYYPIRTDSEDHTGSPWVTAAITHNTDGSKSVTVSVDITGYELSGKGAHGFTVSGSREIQLTHIPRESTIGAADAAIESISTVSVSRKSTAYQHSVAYHFGSLSGYLTASGGISSTEVKFTASSIPFAIPTAFYGQIPNSKTGICTLTCRTYSGSNQIGSATTCQFTVTALEDRCAPTVTGMVVDVNGATLALTGDENVLVRYMSTALCTISAAARQSASVTAKEIAGVVVSGSTRTIPKTEWSSYDFTATDSRGYSKKITVTKTMIPYVLLTCVASGQRTDPTSGNAVITLKGDCFNGSFGAASNTLTVRYRRSGGSWISLTPTRKGNTYTASVSLTGLDYTSSFLYTVEVSDQLSTVTKTVQIEKGIPVFDWGEEDFAFHVPVHCLAGGSGFAPVGFGLGSSSAAVDDLNGCVKNGWYWTGASTANAPEDMAYSAVHVCTRLSGQVVQTLFGMNAQQGCQMNRHTLDGGVTWVEEWVNPPMYANEEYRTTERVGGKAVYVMRINCGTLPNTSSKSVATTIPSAASTVSAAGIAVASTGVAEPMPCVEYNGKVNCAFFVTAGKNININTFADMSTYTGYITVRYTKD